ncbi:hypothetical protein [Paracoccus methylarcula]|uniref:hypothetical protein n=1 Tax=Paracoccus methylarcula TaxID=72022 RepID=UPI001476558A|nr:hypothetical protein [Paracoccus methylarcula]
MLRNQLEYPAVGGVATGGKPGITSQSGLPGSKVIEAERTANHLRDACNLPVPLKEPY